MKNMVAFKWAVIIAVMVAILYSEMSIWATMLWGVIYVAHAFLFY
jgi:hypothetical protein